MAIRSLVGRAAMFEQLPRHERFRNCPRLATMSCAIEAETAFDTALPTCQTAFQVAQLPGKPLTSKQARDAEASSMVVSPGQVGSS